MWEVCPTASGMQLNQIVMFMLLYHLSILSEFKMKEKMMQMPGKYSFFLKQWILENTERGGNTDTS